MSLALPQRRREAHLRACASGLLLREPEWPGIAVRLPCQRAACKLTTTMAQSGEMYILTSISPPALIHLFPLLIHNRRKTQFSVRHTEENNTYLSPSPQIGRSFGILLMENYYLFFVIGTLLIQSASFGKYSLRDGQVFFPFLSGQQERSITSNSLCDMFLV